MTRYGGGKRRRKGSTPEVRGLGGGRPFPYFCGVFLSNEALN